MQNVPPLINKDYVVLYGGTTRYDMCFCSVRCRNPYFSGKVNFHLRRGVGGEFNLSFVDG